MSVTLVTTAGASDANGYCTVAEADAYHDTLLFRTDWPDTGTNVAQVKERAIITATRLLDALWVWYAYQTHPEIQSLQWPRQALLKRGGWVFQPFDQVPPELKNATAEFGRQLIAADRSADNDVQTQGLKALSVGSISLSFKDDVYAKVVPDAVVNLIPTEWGYLRGNRPSRPLYRT